MDKKEFLKPNKNKIKIFITIVLIAGICFAVAANAAGKSFSSGLLWGPSIKPGFYETIAIILSFVLFLPTLIIWVLGYSLIKIFSIILGLILNISYWYYISCLVYLWSVKRKKTLVP